MGKRREGKDMNDKAGKVAVAMSGGVDSSVAAASLCEEGYEVVGVTFRMWVEGSGPAPPGPAGRCSLFDVEAAAGAARVLGIKHVVIDLRWRFFSEVVEPFAREYLRGRTPNPCVECNRRVKFPALVEAAAAEGADLVATGHYARVERDAGGAAFLMRAAVEEKDQSYALYGLGQEILGRCFFPNGGRSKRELRKEALTRGLPAAEKPESQEICFLRGGDYRDFIASRFPESLSPGPILDTSGRVLGEHRGIAFYTVGQRRGLGVSTSHPLYVAALDPSRRAVVLGSREEVPGDRLKAESAHWMKGEPPGESFEAEAMARYNTVPVPCRVKVTGNGFEAFFDQRVWALTPGQHAVLYRGEEILGGGIIASAG
jgi:tRNA-specific 2-thiouridylase